MRRLVRRPNWHLERRTLWVVALLLLVLSGVGLAVADLVRGFDSSLALLIVVFAALVGWGLATAPVATWQGFMAASVAGAAVVLLRVARLGQPLLEIIRAFASAWWASLHPAPDPVPPFEIVAQAILRLTSVLTVLLSRIGAWLQALLAGEPVYDPLAAALVWSVLLWGAATWAAWATRRGTRPLLGVIPALALGGAAIRYAGGSWTLFLVPLGATLMLMASAGHDARHRRWEALRIGTPEGLGTSLAQSAVPVTLALVMAGALIPSLSVQDAARFLQRFRSEPETPQDRIARSLGLEPQSPSGSELLYPRSPELPNRHLIGSGPDLAENLVMTTIITGLPFEAPTPTYYWRGVTYDRYFGNGWGSSPTVTWEYRAGDPAVSEVPQNHRVVRQRIQVQTDLGGLAYAAGTLAVLDQAYEVAWRSAPVDRLGASVEGTEYEVESLVPIADPAQLSSAGIDYPDWIRDRYLDLPEDLPDRVVALARDLTATAATPYDRAVALETYLRGFPYNLDVPAPPANHDVTDWFLFDLKEGYCDYYATAMAVLARAAGLPARLVVGFYTGTAERSEGVIRYLVTEAESHSWVEIYFPGQGWVEFEPTAGRLAIVRSEAEDALPDPAPERLQIADRAAAARWEGLVSDAQRAAGIGLMLVSATVMGWVLWDRWQLGRLSHRRAVPVLYKRLFNAAGRVGLLLDPGTTPYEFGQALLNLTRIDPSRPWWVTVLTPATGDLRRLIDLQVQTAFSRAPPAPEEVNQAIRLWPQLSRRLFLARILSAMERRRRRPPLANA